MNASSKRNSKVNKQASNLRAKIEVDGSSLRVRFTYQGKRRAYGLKLPNTPEGWAIAQQGAAKLHLAILQGTVSERISDYFPHLQKPTGTTEILRKESEGNDLPLDIQNLYGIYIEYARGSIQESTFTNSYKAIQKLLNKLPSIPPMQALRVREELLKTTTTDQTRRALMKLGQMGRWATQHGYLEKNPYEGMYRDMPKPNYEINPQPNPFKSYEAIQIQCDFFDGGEHHHYWEFVGFLFATGCRPGEAIALQREDIDYEAKVIRIRRTAQKINGKITIADTTKTGEVREFPLTPDVEVYVNTQISANGLVFRNKKGGIINYDNFVRRHWKKVVDPIKEGTTPYNCRDTFITRQCLNYGIPPLVVARWVGNSVETIEKYYLGKSAPEGYVPRND